MGLSVANVLLEVIGDSSKARKELADVARDLALFGREEAEATTYVDSSEAQRELDELRVQLAAIDGKEVSAEVNLKVGKAQADLTALQAELKKVDGEDVTVDVDVKRGVVERVGALSKLVAQLGEDTQAASGGGIAAFVRSVLDADIGVGRWSASLGSILKVGPLVIAVVLAIVGQLVAIVASAANAAGAVGALAVSFGAVLVPGIMLAVGAVARFKDQSEIAGTAAHALSEAFGRFGEVFQRATAGGADGMFRGLAAALQSLTPVIDSLGPAFTRLGQAGGDAFRLLGEQFSSPAWRKFFVFTTDSLTTLTPLFARSFGAFAEILANIATAAMPYLIKGFRAIAEGLESIADKTSDIGGLRDVIGSMMDSLRVWGHLLGGVIDLAAAFVAAFAPIGDSIVAALGDGAHNLADWLRSSEGLDKVKQFFEDTGPLAAELGKLLLNIALAFVQITQFVAPMITPIVAGFNDILGVLNKVLSWLNDNVSNGFREALGTVVSFIGGFGKLGKAGEELGGVLRVLMGVAGTLGGAFGDAGKAIVEAFSDALDVAKDVVGKIASVVSAPITFALGFASDIPGRARGIWESVKGVISDGIRFVLQFADDIANRARNIWSAVKGVITDTVKFVLQFADDLAGRARGIWGAVKNVITDAINFILSLPGDLASRARNIWETVRGVITDGIDFVLGFASGIVEKARALWEKVREAVSGAVDLVVRIVPDISGLPGKVVDALGFANGVTDLWESMFAIVGEQGPELAFLPQGSDIYTAGETRNILKALGRGASAPAAASGAAVAPVGAGSITQNYDLKVISPGTGSPDPDIALAKIAAGLRARGGLKPA